MLKEFKDKHRHYYIDEKYRLQGEDTWWWDNGQLWTRCFYVDGKLTGEYKSWWENGTQSRYLFYNNGKKHGEHKEWDPSGILSIHCFHVEGNPVPFSKLPYPETDEDRMYFKLKYNLPLLPVEKVC